MMNNTLLAVIAGALIVLAVQGAFPRANAQLPPIGGCGIQKWNPCYVAITSMP
jgi:hypothetical protein